MVDFCTQLVGIYLLQTKSRCKYNQKIVLINLSCQHLGFASFQIYNLITSIFNVTKSKNVYYVEYFIRGTIAAVYPLFMHYITIDRLFEIHFHMKYPIYFTKRVTVCICIVLWSISGIVGMLNGGLKFYYKVMYILPRYIFATLSFSVLITVIITYTYVYFKWKSLRKRIPKFRGASPAKTHYFLIPILIVFTYILFEIGGSVISIIQNASSLTEVNHKIIRCIVLIFFACGAISDVVIYILLQKTIRKTIWNTIRSRFHTRHRKLRQDTFQNETSQQSSTCRSHKSSVLSNSKQEANISQKKLSTEKQRQLIFTESTEKGQRQKTSIERGLETKEKIFIIPTNNTVTTNL